MHIIFDNSFRFLWYNGYMKKIVICILVVIVLSISGVGAWLYFSQDKDMTVSRIGIGGGGAFFNPMIDPTDENTLYVTSDMGALYYSSNKGVTWDRSEARAVFARTHVSENGVVFAGGCGVYASLDKGKTLELIYPKDVKYSVGIFRL